jgi:hypothetical protein
LQVNPLKPAIVPDQIAAGADQRERESLRVIIE